jgi:hypothetical protein
MNNYDLLSLSWIEFEDLTRDLLQCEFNEKKEGNGMFDPAEVRIRWQEAERQILEAQQQKQTLERKLQESERQRVQLEQKLREHGISF